MLLDNFKFTSTWLDPALYLVRGIGLSSPPSSPSEGDVYVDSSNRYLRFDGSAFVVVGIAQTDDRVVNLDSTTSNVFDFDGSSWIDNGTEEDNSVIMVNDDGTGTTRQYYYDAQIDLWTLHTCVLETAFCPTLDGGAACTVFLPEQAVDGGGACTIYVPPQGIDGGGACGLYHTCGVC